MIARLQIVWTLFLVLGPLAWLLALWPHSPAWALAGVAVGWVIFAAVMGLQFMLMHRANRLDPAPRARTAQVWRAWWHEMGAALAVFCWRQPFRSRAIPDWLPATPTGQRGVVLVHGFLCNRGLWRPWMAPLRAGGHAYVAVNLEPVFGSIDDYPALIDDAVRRVARATGMAPVIIGHSMGGLATRAWLRACQDDARVHHVITLGTPHGGTWLGRYSQATNGQQMRLGSDWVRQLLADEPAARAGRFTCWYSNCDNIVFPATTAVLSGSRQRFVAGLAHVEMACDEQVMVECLKELAKTD
jgi:triacylglycerol esterase/lipase EstA (alpha/beta hydrolase family)